MTIVKTFPRRELLQRAGGAGLLLASGSALAACGSKKGLIPETTTTAERPRRGGTLHVGMVGAGKSESFNPANAGSSLITVAMAFAVFDSLVRVDADLKVQPGLATKWTPNAAADVWDVTLRDGVTWHDGKPFTAQDVVYTLRWMGKPTNALVNTVANVDLPKVRALGRLGVRIPLKRPNPELPTVFAPTWIVQNGATDFTKPVGTGPFMYQSLKPGQQSVMARNPRYWDAGKPYVDKLIIQSIDDNTARLNALMGGQIDVMAQVPYAEAKAQRTGGRIKLLDSPSTSAAAFYMAVDEQPFNDVRVRQALRLLADRKALIETTLAGFGQLGNDLIGQGVEYYASDLPQRERDVERAKALLAAAGHGSGLSVTLQTSSAVPGMAEAATLFAQQAKDGGVKVKMEQVPANAYFDPTLKYLKMPFAQTLWTGITDLGAFYPYAIASDGTYNETHWKDRTTDRLIAEATTATDRAAAARAWAQVQRQQYDEGGYIVWATSNNVDATSTRVAGITPSKYLNLGMPYGLTDAYLVT
jgi:peptide/nickel transport system substrate-binding protein